MNDWHGLSGLSKIIQELKIIVHFIFKSSTNLIVDYQHHKYHYSNKITIIDSRGSKSLPRLAQPFFIGRMFLQNLARPTKLLDAWPNVNTFFEIHHTDSKKKSRTIALFTDFSNLFLDNWESHYPLNKPNGVFSTMLPLQITCSFLMTNLTWKS